MKLDRGVRQLTAVEIAELSMQRGATSRPNGTADFDVALLDTEWWQSALNRITTYSRLPLVGPPGLEPGTKGR